MTEDRKRLGQRGEDAAAAYLERAGMTVIERNWRCTAGEVDIVALDGETVVLCEVKTRRTVAKGTPEDSITPAKQRKYSRLGQSYLQHVGDPNLSLRFDVVTVLAVGEDRALLRHYRSAFVPDSE
jgi:putative endonuclease